MVMSAGDLREIHVQRTEGLFVISPEDMAIDNY